MHGVLAASTRSSRLPGGASNIVLLSGNVLTQSRLKAVQVSNVDQQMTKENMQAKKCTYVLSKIKIKSSCRIIKYELYNISYKRLTGQSLHRPRVICPKEKDSSKLLPVIRSDLLLDTLKNVHGRVSEDKKNKKKIKYRRRRGRRRRSRSIRKSRKLFTPTQ